MLLKIFAKIKIEYVITTFFGAGFFPKIPGTFASLIAFIPIIFIPNEYRFEILFAAIIIFGIVSIPLISKVEREKGNDSSIIVIDEVIGVWLVFCSPFIPISWFSFILGMILFRCFDILKPSIIGKINKKTGAIYVLLDDILAGIFSLILLHLIYFILKFAVFLKIIAVFRDF